MDAVIPCREIRESGYLRILIQGFKKRACEIFSAAVKWKVRTTNVLEVLVRIQDGKEDIYD
jgi:hypothetical protein